MSFFASLLGSGPPPFIELDGASERNAPSTQDRMYTHPRRHRWRREDSNPSPRQASSGRSRDSTRPPTSDKANLRRVTSPVVKISQLGAEQPTKASEQAGMLMDILKRQIEGHLQQTAMSDPEIKTAVISISSAADKPNAEEIIKAYLEGQPRGFIASILGCVFSYRSGRGIPDTPTETRRRDWEPPQSRASSSRRTQSPAKANDLKFLSNTRRFQSSTGSFQYHTSASSHDIETPPSAAGQSAKAGDVYIHVNNGHEDPEHQVWMYGERNTWEDISDIWHERKLLVHPKLPDRVLKVRDDGTPNWILKKRISSMNMAWKGDENVFRFRQELQRGMLVAAGPLYILPAMKVTRYAIRSHLIALPLVITFCFRVPRRSSKISSSSYSSTFESVQIYKHRRLKEAD
ncbi:hypothetical protein B0H11DRAFT_1944691 [Mycena galericulata]|nr:hypothetical protein B0H11DRAFT_1944691 [Mycena galericulata]